MRLFCMAVQSLSYLHGCVIKYLFVLFIMTKNLKKFFHKDKSVSMHNRDLQVLTTEMYKVTKELSQKVFGNIFTSR